MTPHWRGPVAGLLVVAIFSWGFWATGTPLGEAVGRLKEVLSIMAIVVLIVPLIRGMYEDSRSLYKRLKITRRSLPWRAMLDAAAAIMIRDTEVTSQIADILVAHDEHLSVHPRTWWWRGYVHACAVAAVAKTLLLYKGGTLLVRAVDRVLGTVVAAFRRR